MCCHAPRGALFPPARTVYQRVGPRSRCRVLCALAFRMSEELAVSGKPPDSGPVRKAEGHSRYRRSTFRKILRAFAAATARHTTASQAAARVPGIGRWLPVRADLVATKVPLVLAPTGLIKRLRRSSAARQFEIDARANRGGPGGANGAGLSPVLSSAAAGVALVSAPAWVSAA